MLSRDRFALLRVSAVVLSVVGLVGCQYLFDFLDPQPTAVASPTDLAATASASANSISLSWTASTTSGATYRVYRGTSAGGEAATPIGTSTAAEYTDAASTLQPNTTYYYCVTAVSNDVESAKSNEAHATTKNTGGTVVPAPATDLAATASTSAISISLSWTASTTSGATYRVYRGTSAGGEAATPIGTSTAAEYTDAASTLQPNTTYYYYVTAVSGGVESAESNEAHATTKNTGGTVVPAPATDLVATASTSAISISLSWTASTTSGATYRVYRGTSAGGEAATPIGTSTTADYTDAASTLQPNTTYYYYVTAVSGGVESAESNEAHATTKNTGGTVVPAPAVTFHRVAPSVFLDPPYNYDLADQYVHLIWQGPSSGVSYTVLRSTDINFTDPEGTDVTGLDTSWTGYVNGYFYDGSTGGYDFWDNTAQFGENYYYAVFRTNDADGAVSPSSNVVTAGAPAPTNVTAVENGDATVTVSWDAVADASDYDVEFVDSDGIYLGHHQMYGAGTSVTITDAEYGFQNGTYYFTVNAYVSDWGYYSLSNPLTYSW